jgi:hypothetical protein
MFDKWAEWLFSTGVALFFYFFVETPIKNAILNGLNITLSVDSESKFFLLAFKVILAIVSFIWFKNLFSSHP